jgi:hypothetical protein
VDVRGDGRRTLTKERGHGQWNRVALDRAVEQIVAPAAIRLDNELACIGERLPVLTLVVCVRATVQDAFAYGFTAVVPRDAEPGMTLQARAG